MATIEPAPLVNPSITAQGNKLPDFASFPEKYGWPKASSSGYQIVEQPCGFESECHS
jgi:hypothetical protein